MFSKFTAAADKLKNSVANAAAYKGNMDVLEGKVAAQLLVAYADGNCSAEEEQEALDTLNNDKMLEAAGFTQMQIADTWSRLQQKRPNMPTGKIQLRREIAEAVSRAKSKGTAQVGEDIFLGAVNVAYASGDADEKEVAELKLIAQACSVDPNKLGIPL